MRYRFNPLTGGFDLIGDPGAVSSVNGQTGDVVLSGNDINVEMIMPGGGVAQGSVQSMSSVYGNSLNNKANKAGDRITGTYTMGPESGFGTIAQFVRDDVNVGRIDNNQLSGGGIRVQAQTGQLQLRGTTNNGFLIDAAEITSELPIDAGANSISSSFVPTADDHLANKLYVDDAVDGLGTLESSTMPLVYDYASKNISMTLGNVGQVLGTIEDPGVGPAVAWTDAPGVAEAVADISSDGTSTIGEIENKINSILEALRNAGLMET